MGTKGPTTGFKVTDPNTGNQQDLGDRYVSKDYLIDVYPNLVPGRTSPGLWSWGYNGYGGLGLNDRTPRSSPVQVGSLTDWKYVFLGSSPHSAAIKTNGTLWTWGDNTNGQLAQGDTTPRSSPVQVGALTNWKYVDGGQYTLFTISTDGKIWAAGRNDVGQLGLGDTAQRNTLTQIGALTTWNSICAGGWAGFAIKTDGTLWSWGLNSVGTLGLNDTTNRSSPVQVGTSTNWKQISVNNGSVMALKTDGTLWAWGHNQFGQLGVGDVTHRSSPVQVGSLTNWKAVFAGKYDSSLAIKTDGTLWAWGHNLAGQLGLNDITHRSSPVQVGSLTNWKTIGSGGYVVSAIKTDGTLWTWGQGGSGQLGQNNQTSYSSPVQVGSLTRWKKTSAGNAAVVSISDGYF